MTNKPLVDYTMVAENDDEYVTWHLPLISAMSNMIDRSFKMVPPTDEKSWIVCRSSKEGQGANQGLRN